MVIDDFYLIILHNYVLNLQAVPSQMEFIQFSSKFNVKYKKKFSRLNPILILFFNRLPSSCSNERISSDAKSTTTSVLSTKTTAVSLKLKNKISNFRMLKKKFLLDLFTEFNKIRRLSIKVLFIKHQKDINFRHHTTWP